MNNLSKRIADLPPEKRSLFEQQLGEKRNASTKKQLLPPIRRCAHDQALPLSFSQERLWFLNQLEPGGAAYNISIAFRLAGQLNLRVLEQSLNEMVHRHESLRTTFAVKDEQPVQVTIPDLTLALAVNDLGLLSEMEREVRVRELLIRESQLSFDLTQGPLLRAVLLRLGRQEHILLLVMHHIISDGWSMEVFKRELAILYAAFSAGQPSPLAEPLIQYADYACWQREWLQGELLERQLAYWQKQLSQILPSLDLPTDRPRPAVQTFRGATQSFLLPMALTEALQAQSRQEGVTLFMMLLAAFKTLLYRYTGQENIAVGTPVANRTQIEIEGLIGFFVNTLVLRTDLTGNLTFRELLARVREITLGAFAHQDVPFEKLVEVLHPERDMSRNPLFQVMFVLQNTPAEPVRLPGLSVTPVEIESKAAQFDLTVSVEETDQGLYGLIEYNTDLFDANTIKQLAKHYRVLLEAVVTKEGPGQPLWQLPLLTEAERHQLLMKWNDTGANYAQGKCLHQLFEEQVERTPDAVAALFEGEQTTYAELNRRSNQLAHYLQKMGVGPEVLVGIYVGRSLDLLVGILGILKAGGAYVPLDVAYPPERLAFILEDTQVLALLTQERLAGELPGQRPPVVRLDADWEIIAQEGQENPVSGVTADNLAYVIYTSGSTGKPKGTLISHYHVIRLFEATHPWFHFDERDVWTLFHTYAFDFSVWELWGAFLYGGRLVVVPFLVSRSPEMFYALLCREQVTVLNQTPSAFRQLIWAEEFLGVAKDLTLRLVIFGGEALELNSLRPWYERHRDQGPQLINMYGITETTVHVTYRPLKAADLSDARGSVIGEPIPDLQVYVLDQHLQPVPIGVAGEMYVGGAGLSRGYLGRPDLSSERFIPDPFGHQPGARLYKSGDQGRYLFTGDIEYLGRIDYQVKVRGFRVELGEIEAVLGQHPDVRTVVILAREDVPGEKRLVAYIVSNQERIPTAGELRGFLAEKLPEYMVPSAFVFLDALPLTPNGKIDRHAFPVPDTVRPETGQEFAAPRTLVEETLAGIWAEILGLEQIGIHDNFFDLGGHSLLATRVVSRLRETLMVELPLRAMFEAPTVAELSNLIVANETGPGQTEQIARILKMVNSMSDQDAKELLHNKKEPR